MSQKVITKMTGDGKGVLRLHFPCFFTCFSATDKLDLGNEDSPQNAETALYNPWF